MTTPPKISPALWHTTAWRLAAVAALALLPALSAGAAEPVYYYDGTQRIAIVRQPELVAEFAASRRTAQAAPVAGPATTPVAGDQVVRIVRVNAASGAAAAAAPGQGQSPVYRQGSSPSGRLMALPGGVLVKFQPAWSASRINAWLAGRGLPPAQAQAIGPGWYLVPTAPGLVALETANALQESGAVLAASPNWWTETAKR